MLCLVLLLGLVLFEPFLGLVARQFGVGRAFRQNS